MKLLLVLCINRRISVLITCLNYGGSCCFSDCCSTPCFGIAVFCGCATPSVSDDEYKDITEQREQIVLVIVRHGETYPRYLRGFNLRSCNDYVNTEVLSTLITMFRNALYVVFKGTSVGVVQPLQNNYNWNQYVWFAYLFNSLKLFYLMQATYFHEFDLFIPILVLLYYFGCLL